jgi:2-aminobenzoate-CoA ligase
MQCLDRHAFLPKPVANRAPSSRWQAFVKVRIAPYKYPRAIAPIDALPRTETGKLKRFAGRAERGV